MNPLRFSKPAERLIRAAGLGLAVAVAVIAIQATGFLSVLELKTLDHRFAASADPQSASDDLVLLAIDERSLESFGRWPWPRDRYAYVLEYLKAAGARAVVFDILFSEPDEADPEFDAAFAAAAARTGFVYFAAQLQRDVAVPPSPDVMEKATVTIRGEPPMPSPAGDHVLNPPIPPLAAAAKGIGFINLLPDEDGTSRRLPLGLQIPGASRGYQALSASVGRDLVDATSLERRDGSVRLGSTSVRVAPSGDMLLNWHGRLDAEQPVYAAYSIGAVLQSYAEQRDGRAPLLDPALFRDKVVFIAGTAAGTYDLRVTPLSPTTPGVLVHMTALDNLLSGRALAPAPGWVFPLAMVVLCLATSLAFAWIERAAIKLFVIAGLAAAYYAHVMHVFASHAVWLQLVWPETGIALTYAAAATIEYMTEGRRRRQLRQVFDRYMGADVVEEITRDPERVRLGGERRELTILFSDVAGFTSVSEKLPPEALVELLNEYLSDMTAIIFQHRGNVNKYLGDGIMAIFGAPLDDAHHARQACYAALDSQAALVQLRAAWRARGLPDLSARIGINSGPVVVGNVGSSARMEYTVMGDHVNLASRLEGANKYYGTGILIGPRTYELASEAIEAREVDRLRVKGKQEPVTVYEVMGRKGDLTAERAALVERYRHALALYQRREFADAVVKFQAALETDRADDLSRVYLNRAQRYAVAPPPPDWDGVYELTDK
ncbi:MAG TPA: adenylate/guanylate cyclase domain-containing protein [Nitrospirales bacterium]|nr:adenylate/guanylate cyclase domain-containing protein [Nitrospirales bacterium]